MSLRKSYGIAAGWPRGAGRSLGIPTPVPSVSVNFDLVVYGATPVGIMAAIEAKRQGKTVCIVGGWRERRVGGMMTGGLGLTDCTYKPIISGLAREFFYQSNQMRGGTSASGDTRTNTTIFNINFEPEHARTIFENWLTAYNIPVYFSGGLTSVAKTGTRITAITVQGGGPYLGRTVAGKYFLDGSYEGDLLAQAGCSYTTGREAADVNNTNNGFVGTTGTQKEFYGTSQSSLIAIDPYVIPGDSASGLIPGVVPKPATAIGAADNANMAFCYRQNLTNIAGRRVAMPNTPPPGYASWLAGQGEILGRWCAARTALANPVVLGDLVTSGIIGAGNIADYNNNGPISLNLLDKSSWGYSELDYAAREVIWKKHENHQRAFWYYLQYDADSRIPSAVRTSALNTGYISDHYTTGIHENDSIYWPTQLYVRASRRLVSDVIWWESDIKGVDGTTPRSIKTIGMGAYTIDTHHAQRYAELSGTPRLWNEGNIQASGGGTDTAFTIPYDICIPKASECTNLFVGFCFSSTYTANGALRLETNEMIVGQSLGFATAQAIDQGLVDVQSVDYPSLRARCLASADPIPMYLPQTN